MSQLNFVARMPQVTDRDTPFVAGDWRQEASGEKLITTEGILTAPPRA